MFYHITKNFCTWLIDSSFRIQPGQTVEAGMLLNYQLEMFCCFAYSDKMILVNTMGI